MPELTQPVMTPEDLRSEAAQRRREWVRKHGLRIHVINLERRGDRWARVENIACEHPSVSFVRQPAIDLPSHPWIACALGHQLAVYGAKLRGDPYVLVAEDDIEPTFWFGRLAECVALGEERGYGAIYGGTVSFPEGVVGDERSSIVETDTILSSHLTCYYARAYNAVLSWPIGWGSDYNRDPAVHPDHQERMRLAPPIPMKRGLCVPFLATQISGYSDNCRRMVNLETHWADAEAAWLRAVANK